jgi:Uma2 family endonuclease
MPITLVSSEPEPDIAVVQRRNDAYSSAHPIPADIFLLIEISATTLEFDLDVKGLTYAQAGIDKYWVLDVTNRSLYVLREPNDAGYQSQTILQATDRITPLAFPHTEITIANLLIPAVSESLN